MTEQGFTVWLTGMSGAGKSTVARGLEEAFAKRGRRAEVLDGDEVRAHLSRGLGFSREDRDTNIRRIAYVANLVTRNSGIAIVAAISPYRNTRSEVRELIGAFVEVHVQCPIGVLVERDNKGLYARALRGEITQFTGVSDPYEEPVTPEVVLHTDQETPEDSVSKILVYLEAAGYVASATGQIAPHGGRLVNRLVKPEEATGLYERLPSLPTLSLTARARSDVDMISVGAYSPLEGFLGHRDYDNVLERMRLANGLPWSLPITLGVTDTQAESLEVGCEIGLVDNQQRTVAVLLLTERYERDSTREAQHVYGTTDPAHPGVAALHREGSVLLAGSVTVLHRAMLPGFEMYALDPLETRQRFAERGWRTIVGFQTRNPMHRAHEYITKVALEITDGLLLHPLVGETKADDIPADVRLRCYEALVANYYPRGRVQLAVLQAAMRYAGPREAIFHAIVRRNFGCTHFIVGRDHAGVGNYYGPYDAQDIFTDFAPRELGIMPLFFENAFYSERIGGMATEKTAPPEEGDTRIRLSGTQVRQMLRRGESLPPQFTRPEVARILADSQYDPPATGIGKSER